MQQEEKIIKLNIDLLVPNEYQPRKKFNELSLNELANSIKEYGILNPILVTEKNGKYEIIAGERRYRAAKKVGLTEIPVIIKTLDEQKKAEIALIENLQRETLTPIEEAMSYKEIMKLGNLTQESLGQKIGKSQSAIANKLRLLNLPKSIQEALNNKQISERHARSLTTVKSEEEQNNLLKKIIENKMTVKELDNLINQQSVTEEEIKTAIDDIMKSLNLIEEEKEEKESDNMNNGNFFPNFNNNMQTPNNVSLNSMNMQSMVQPQMQPMPETTMPTPPVQPPVEPIPQMPVMKETPLFGGPISEPVMPQVEIVPPVQEPQVLEPANNNVTFETNNINGEPLLFSQQLQEPVVTEQTPVEPISQVPVMEEAPLFGGPVTEPVMPQVEIAPIIEETPIPETVTPEVPVETPIFTSPTNAFEAPVAPMDAPVMEEAPQTFEVPVMMENPEITLSTPTVSVDRVTEIKNLLEQNGINYKSYSNEQGHCIIIEI